jgi:hypothetical protein
LKYRPDGSTYFDKVLNKRTSINTQYFDLRNQTKYRRKTIEDEYKICETEYAETAACFEEEEV